MPHFERRTIVLSVVAIVAVLGTIGLRLGGASEVAIFLTAAAALASLASLVGEGTDQIGARLGPSATGVLQSALGNLPELFISLFALQAGLNVLVQTALIGSILANSLLVLGLAFFAGGVTHGTQRFGTEATHRISVLLVLAVAAIVIPSLATAPGAPDAGHAVELSVVVAIVLLVVFIASIPFALRKQEAAPGGDGALVESAHLWPLRWAIGLVTVSAVAAAFVSDWFVEALRPAMASLHISEAFVGLVVVAIAGNAVENVVGIRAAMRNKADVAISLIQNSSLQVAIAMTPLLVIISLFVGPAPLTLVVSPLLLGAVALSAILGALIVFDGESNWLEGLALIGLYVIIAASVWWGPAVQL